MLPQNTVHTPVKPPLIIANWKMHELRKSASVLAERLVEEVMAHDYTSFEIVLCPPAILLHPLKEIVQNTLLKLGGQDCGTQGFGPFTGDISAAMLTDAGAEYVILGHSERRLGYGETDDVIERKMTAAHDSGLNVILCVGETLEERAQGKAVEKTCMQIRESLSTSATSSNTVIAYEPVWAIGSGQVPKPKNIAQMHNEIRAFTCANPSFASGVRVVYGGSAKLANAAELLEISEVDGLLVGGASLIAEEFIGIMRTAVREYVTV